MTQSKLLSGIAAATMMLGVTSGGAIAQMPHEGMDSTEQTGDFQRIDQPLWIKGAVTVGGLGLIGVELWWFLFSKPKARRATSKGDIQEITVTVDGGYEPSQIVVQAGQPVRLNFARKDPSSCLEEVRFPDFRITKELPLNHITPIEFTPDKPGQYEFTCGMNMFRGVVAVQGNEQTTTAVAPPPREIAPSPQTNHHAEHPAHPLPEAVTPASSVEAILSADGVQEATITVANSYQPRRVIVTTGYPIRLYFNRINPSSCYDQLLIPDFAIAVDLALDETTRVEFIPEQAGEYEFMCGMKMNSGIIEVRDSRGSNA